MMLTLVGLLGDGFPSKFELAAVADDDGGPRPVLFVCRNINDPRDDVFVTTDHPAEHHVFAWLVRVEDQWIDVRMWARRGECVEESEGANRSVNGNEDGKRLNSIMHEKGRVRGITHHSGGGTASG